MYHINIYPYNFIYLESIMIHLGTCLQILIGDQMMKRYTDGDDEEDDDILSDEQIFDALRDANHCFKESLKSAR